MNTVEQENKIRVLVVEPERAPYVKDIDSGLRSLQSAVGGYIEAVYPFEDPVAIVLDEEGKLCGKALNRALRSEEGSIYDILAGTFLVTGLTEDNFGSLSDDLIKKYTDFFKTPEMFFNIGGHIIAIPMEPEEGIGDRDNEPTGEKASFEDQLQSAQTRAQASQSTNDGKVQIPPEPEH